MTSARRGTVLILIAGIAAIIAALCATFLVRMRSDVDEMRIVEREAQARIMLTAACSYVQEAARIGYDRLADPDANELRHREAYGWIDVRTGEIGPLGEALPATGAGAPTDPWPTTTDIPATFVSPPAAPTSSFARLYSDADVEDGDGDGAPDRPAWPAIHGVARCPMDVPVRPPFAISPAMYRNQIATEGPDFGMPYLTKPDPLPAIADKAAFWAGDARIRAEGGDRAWFRVYRDDAATFVVTCGAGGTHGYRDWREVQGMRGQDEFGGDQALFEQLRLEETRAWYRIEWSAAVAPSEVHNIANAMIGNAGKPVDQYGSFPINTSDCTDAPTPYEPPNKKASRSQAHCVNMAGTIRWTQRLRTEPTAY